MELVLVEIRLLQVTEDLVKEAFIQRSVATGRIEPLTIIDIIESHPPDLYDYRADGKYLEYIISTDELNKLFNVIQQHRLQINSVRFEEFEDCVEVNDGGSNIIITCKDASLGNKNERIVYLNKQTIRKYVGIRWEYPKPTKSIEEALKQDEVAIDVEAGIKLTIYFTIDTPRTPLEDVADAYIALLRRGINEVPTPNEVAPIALTNESEYIKAYLQGAQVRQLLNNNDMELSIDGRIAILSHNSTQLMKLDAATLDDYLVKVVWADLNTLKISSIDYELINLGSNDLTECSESIVENSLKSYSKALG